ncbi:MAG: DHH family phosphoesterase [Oscillospiraceae bacterium]|nr:DHH family phosphoesterase [Oscillospiraceae bacterium]
MNRKKGNIVMPLVYAVIAAFVLIAAAVLFIKSRSVMLWSILPICGISAAAVFLFAFYMREEVTSYLSKLAVSLGLGGKNAPDNVNITPVPMVSIDGRGDIIWYNSLFREKITNSVDANNSNLTDFIKDISLEDIKEGVRFTVSLEKLFYEVIPVSYSYHSSEQYMIFLRDVTELHRIKEKARKNSPVVILVMFDNEDELIRVRENEKIGIISQMNEKLNAWIEPTSGICRSDARGESVIVVTESDLAKIKADKFSILSEMKKITVGGQSVTISIGVGSGGKTISECEVWARYALDMALGRGGDQAAIKDADGYSFYGGLAKSSEKQSKVKTRMLAQGMSDLIQGADKCFVMGHRFSDLDSIGAAIGMASVAASLDTEARVVVDIKTTLSVNLIDAYVDHSGEAESLFISPQEAVSEITDSSVLIVVDTHSTEFLESKELYSKARNVIVIDHHRLLVNKIENATFFFHEPFASSASEMVAELAQYINEKAIKSAEAEALLAGIMLDTKSFVLKTGVRTFEAATFLRRRGADTVDVKMLFAGSLENYADKNQIISTAKIYRECSIAFADKNIKDIRIISSQAADEMLALQGVSASFVIFETDGCINISSRSFGKINVQIIMEQLGGGGHRTMAGAQLTGVTANQAATLLCEAIDTVYEMLNVSGDK